MWSKSRGSIGEVETFPQLALDKINAALGTSIPCLFLNKTDLDLGHREIPWMDQTRWLNLHDLIPPLFPERPRVKSDKPRTFNIGWGTYTR